MKFHFTPAALLLALIATGCATPGARPMDAVRNLDPEFGVRGVSEIVLPGIEWVMVKAIAVQPDGKTIGVADTQLTKVAGEKSKRPIAVFRLGANGLLDPTFGVGGVTVLDFKRPSDIAQFSSAVSLTHDGKMIVAARVRAPDQEEPTQGGVAIARLNSDGRLDKKFGDAGKVIFRFGEHYKFDINGMATRSDGGVLLAGSDLPFMTVGSVRKDGRIDSKFGEAGVVQVRHKVGSDVIGEFSAVVMQDDRIVLAGAAPMMGDFRPSALLVRLLPTGAVDPAFGTSGNGILIFPTPNFMALIDVKVQEDGSLFALGLVVDRKTGQGRHVIAKATKGGSPDESFGESGLSTVDLSGLNFNPAKLALQKDGKIVVGGSDANGLAVRRFTASGKLDLCFGDATCTQGGSISLKNGEVSHIRLIQIDASGRIVLASNDRKSTKLVVVRLKP